mgnify:CR=1 FL=1
MESDIYAKRDWSDSEDFVEGVWLMMTQEKPRDYILASGETHTIKEFVEREIIAERSRFENKDAARFENHDVS